MTNTEILVTLPTILQNFLHSFIQERVEGHGYTLNAIYNDEPLSKDELTKVIGNAARITLSPWKQWMPRS